MKFLQNNREHLNTKPPVIASLGDSLKIIPLGGTTDVTKNLYVYETKDDILVVDCGIGYPSSEILGVDILIPDTSYLIKKKEKIRGILITHGHEDHIGALSYLLDQVSAPIYATKLVLGFIESRLEERNMLKSARLFLIEPHLGSFNIGEFTITPFYVNHSIPDSLGYCIQTRAGKIFHVADFKFDFSPVIGHVFDIARASQLAKGGVLALLSDCLGSNSPGFTTSESEIEATFDTLIGKAKGKQVLITTISSNISRMYQAIIVARKYGRRVVPIGKSIAKNIEIAQRTGYLSVPEGSLILDDQKRKFRDSEVLYLIAGAYGQPGSALVKAASDANRYIKLQKGAVVIFSADPIPGIFDQVDNLINKLIIKGADVYYSEIQDNLHVSGHGSQGDLQLLASIVHPKYFIPIGGTPKHMRSYAELIAKMGFPRENILELLEGQEIIFKQGSVTLGEKVPTNEIYIDGLQVGGIGPAILRDRQMLANDGLIALFVTISKANNSLSDIKIITRGFVYPEESRELLDKTTKIAKDTFTRHIGKGKDYPFMKSQIEKAVLEFLYGEIERRPLIVSEIIEI
ncbi:ribonuclease J [candidate division WWE3 bacterium CG_4_10_14_0_2_um_filter_42_7]|uniref:Ribonuclease J n=2 Tax=Katanobacteria TaxID=422282 RepID=A0A2H0XAB8_UNCKA|nr:MAG: ribonuclease J [candidate division WWE3 bacterium CG08_land_8_20_14_0_20_41_15]PIZ43559.1 MAG: ribonuclease J [candidate division WWE3 bacterium CG_4_10_14_0_2_um_filter_42_7]